ncbi:MAG TPA: hypothetical protein VKA01_01500 [Vicinamibacteria bacterium]|nr:hypothetical protein [Vicinamibacteria bacterium]
MTAPDLLAALMPVLEALDALGVRCYVGGSVASSIHGVPRASIDADVVAELDADRVAPVAARLRALYYLDEERMRDAVERRLSFNVIHLSTMFKIDVFVSKGRPFDRAAFSRARVDALGEATDAPKARVASPEDTVLAKLEWFRRGGEASERQWTDVVGLLRARSGRLDTAYLEKWAAALGVTDLLERAGREAS